MTVRLPAHLLQLDNRKIAAALAPALLSPAAEDAAPATKATRAGTAWLRWSDVHASSTTRSVKN